MQGGRLLKSQLLSRPPLNLIGGTETLQDEPLTTEREAEIREWLHRITENGANLRQQTGIADLLFALDAARADVRSLATLLAHFAALGYGAPEKRQAALALIARIHKSEVIDAAAHTR